MTSAELSLRRDFTTLLAERRGATCAGSSWAGRLRLSEFNAGAHLEAVVPRVTAGVTA